MRFVRGSVGGVVVSAALLVLMLAPAAQAAGPGGGGGGGGAMQVGTYHGLYLVDQPQPGEAAIGGLVHAGPGADTVVTLNGVTLMPRLDLSAGWFSVDPAGPQPPLGADRFLHLVATSRSTKGTRILNLPCPAPVAVTTSPVAGSSLAGVTSLNIAWTPFPQNVPLFLNGSFLDAPTVLLSSFDLASGAAVSGIALQYLGQQSLNATFTVPPTTSTGYQVTLTYPGVYVLDGQTGGACGRVQRITFAR